MSAKKDPFAGYTEIHEFAEHGPKSLATLRRYVRQGKLQAYKFGNTVYLKDEDLVPEPVPKPERRAAHK